MTTPMIESPVDAIATRAPGSAVIRDTLIMSRRNLRRVMRTPELLVFSSALPISFTLLFHYVFGGAVHIPGLTYVDYLIPTMLVLSPLFGATTAIAMAEDMTGGMIERFRSLPIARSAVLAGRTVADLARTVAVAVIVLGVGLPLGFRFHNGFLPALAAFGLVVAFSFALSWVMAWIGMNLKDPQAAAIAAFLPIFLMTFAGSGIVPVDTLPGWLEAFANVQPVSVTIDAVRALAQGGPIFHPLWQSLTWTVGILAVFMPLAVREYRKV
jgi:ABC-2 type transport system permease protein/oleandomycin transport system permease protein